MENGLGVTSVCQQQSVGAGNSMFAALFQTLLVAECAIAPPGLWPHDLADTLTSNDLGTYDFIVVGAGTAGSVVASRLSENPDWKVLVIEGGGDPPIESEIPKLFLTILRTNYTWNYFSEPDGRTCKANKESRCYWPRGKMIGGSGAINAMLYVRGNREDYDAWERKGNPTWGWDHVLPTFEKSIQLGMSTDSDSDSRKGLKVNSFPVIFPDIEGMFFESAEELGVPQLSGFREGADIGITSVPGTYENGRRSGTGKSYLAAAKDRPNLHVLKNAVVTKINFDSDGKKATGVTILHMDKDEMTAHVSKEIIVSAGTVDSPKILLLSGIGPKKHLASLGIPVLKNLRVGDNLQDHVQLRILFKMNDSALRKWTSQDDLEDAFNYLISKTGSLSGVSPFNIVNFVNSDPNSSSPYPDIGVYFQFLQRGSNNLDTWLKITDFNEPIAKNIREQFEDHHFLAISIALLRPKSVGTLRLRSADPRDPPKLFPNYLDKEEDVETLLRGIEFLTRLEETNAFKKLGTEIAHIELPECDKCTFKSREYWKCYIKYMASTLYHMTGTVKMGPDTDSGAVLDWRLRVKGVKGLRVADASIMPDVPSANTNVPTIMVAERASEFIVEDWAQ